MKKANSSRRRFLRNMAWSSVAATTLPSFQPMAKGNNLPTPPQTDIHLDKMYWASLRKSFPLSHHRKYFNTGALGASPQSVIDEVYKWTMELERMCESGHQHIHEVHKKIADFVNCEPDEIAITRNTTEGMNIVARSLPLKEGDEVILTNHAHVGGAAPWLAVKNDKKIKITMAELDLTGKNNFEIIKNKITEKTKAIVVSHVTCTTGMVLPIKEIIDYCKKKGIFTCIDGAHPLGMMPLNFNELQADFYVSSGHKWLFGPKGTGILYINKNTIKNINPFYAGAHSDEKYDLEQKIFTHNLKAQREEYGTRSTPVIMGLGAAVDFVSGIGVKNIKDRCNYLATRLKDGLVEIPEIEILSPMTPLYSSSIVTFRLPRLTHDQFQYHLSKASGSRIRGIHENNLNAVRISCAIYNNEDEIDELLEGVKKVVEK